MTLRDLRLGIWSVALRPDQDYLEVTAIRPLLQYSENPRERKLIGTRLDCLACRGSILSVKLPLEIEAPLEQIRKMLDNDEPVRVRFVNLTITAYAMPTSDGVRSGVSAKADNIEILENDDDIVIED